MGYEDWVGTSTKIFEMIGVVIWKVIQWPWRFASSLPDWAKGIILGILVLFAAYLLYRLLKSWNRQEWKFIES